MLLPLGDLGWLCLRVCCLYEAGLSPQHPLPSTGLQRGNEGLIELLPHDYSQVKMTFVLLENMSQIKSGCF